MDAADPAELLALRLDDVGACSKRYEVYSEWSWGVGRLRASGNWLFLKYLPPFKRWGPYRELTEHDWSAIYERLRGHHAKLTVAVTAAWAEDETRLIPFPTRFPREAAALREGLQEGLVEIANHGLTHCVLQGNRFKPRWFTSNRAAHREFWESVPLEIQEEHLRRAQEILQGYFQTEVVTFVPPGNIFTQTTLELAWRCGLRYVSCHSPAQLDSHPLILGNEQVFAFHDRDLVLHGMEWLNRQLARLAGLPAQHSTGQAGRKLCTVRELAVAIEAK